MRQLEHAHADGLHGEGIVVAAAAADDFAADASMMVQPVDIDPGEKTHAGPAFCKVTAWFNVTIGGCKASCVLVDSIQGIQQYGTHH